MTAAPAPEALNYSRDVGWSGVVMAEIAARGPSTAVVTFNYDGKPQIGRYACVLPPERFSALLRDVQGSGYLAIDPGDNFSPECKFVAVGERAAGEALPRIRAYDLRAVPPPIAALSARFEAVIDAIRAHPERVVDGAAMWLKPRFTALEPVAASVALTNVGALPLTLATPFGRPPGEWCGARLWIHRPQDAGEQHVVDLEAAHVRPAPNAPGGAVVTLDPGAALAFTLAKRVYLPPGRYDARLSYTTLVDDDQDRQNVGGEIWLSPGVLEIGRA